MRASRMFLVACVSMLTGIAIASWWHVEIQALWLGVVMVGIALLVQRPWSVLCAGALVAMMLGAWRASDVIERASFLWDVASTKPEVSVIGYVDGDFEKTATGGRYVFHAMRIVREDGEHAVDDRILVSGPDWIKPRQGQWLTITAKLQQPKNFADFDYVGYLAKEGIHGTMYFPRYDVPDRNYGSTYTRFSVLCDGLLASIRGAFKEALARAVPQPEAGFLTGILIGAKGNISPALKEAFARTGTSHIVALSGYNITILSTVLIALLTPLGARRAYWIAVFGIGVFVVFVGGGASVVRAAIMGVLALTAQRLGRLSDATMLMAVTACAMCLYNPLLLRWDVGFQLSFLAFAGIVYVQPLIEPWIARIVKWKTLASLIATTLAAQVLVLPLLLHTFNLFAVYTLPVNMLVLPLVPIAMALGFATAVGGMLAPALGMLAGQMAWLVAAYQLAIVQWFARAPYAALNVTISTPLMIALYAALATWLISLYRGRALSNINHHA